MSSRILLLSLLTFGPNTGYGLGKLLRTELWPMPEMKLQQVYGELQHMLSLGLIEVEELPGRRGPPKRQCTITGLGEDAIGAWLVRAPGRVLKDDLFIHLLLFEKGYTTPVRRFVKERIERSEFDLATRRRGQGSESALFRQSAILQHECELQWYRGVLSLLDELLAIAGEGDTSQGPSQPSESLGEADPGRADTKSA